MNKFKQLYLDNLQRKKMPVNLVKNMSEASIYIYDVIDDYWGVSALAVAEAITNAGDAETLHVYINSPGGSVFEGRAIMAEIQRFKGKTIAHIDSLCASAATSVALSCDTVEMADGAFFMIHNASGLAWGDKTTLRETANLLEKIEDAIINDYTKKTGKESSEIIAWMDAETWFSAQEALENGFIDSIKADKNAKNTAKNTWNLAAFENTPEALLKPADPVAVEDPEIIENLTIPEIEFQMTVANSNKLQLLQAL